MAQVREALEGEEDERREQNEQLLVAKEDEVKLLSDKIASLSEQLSLTEKKLEVCIGILSMCTFTRWNDTIKM